jgi:Fur family transcriptional regulator, ferric uptake regulator
MEDPFPLARAGFYCYINDNDNHYQKESDMPNSTGRSVLRKEKLKNGGYRVTSGRKAVLEILNQTHDHLSAGDIFLRLHPAYPHIGLTTVYRTLEILHGLGLVVKFDFGDGRSRYELAEKMQGAKHHHHLICTECNKIIDYRNFNVSETILISKTQKELSERYRFTITHHLMQFLGVCEDCAKKR